MTLMVRCALCDEPVDAEANGTYRKTSGWTQKREGGRGGVRLAAYSDEYAHPTCVDLKASGRLGQETLLA